MYCNWLTSSNVNIGAYGVSAGTVTSVTAHAGVEMDSLVASYGTVYVLPTEDEWYKAAYYKNGSYSLYANGTSTAPTHGTDANFNSGGGYANGPAWKVGDGTGEQNGTTNMMGNVWEWLESAEDGTLDNLGTEDMAFRGGDYFQGVAYLSSDQRSIYPDTPDKEYNNLGFRVVAIPEPGTISLMSLSTLGLFITRRVRRRTLLGRSLLPVRHEHLDSFSTEQEWRLYRDGVEEAGDFLILLADAAKERYYKYKARLSNSFKNADKAFWNGLVVIHERRVAFCAAFSRKALGYLDTLLALIMK